MKKIIILIFIAALIFLNSIFILNETQSAIILQFGEPVRTIETPGLQFKIPLIQKVLFFEKRILNLVAEEKEVITKDQKRLIVNAYAKYKIVNPLQFYISVHDYLGAKNRLGSLFDSSLRLVLGEETLSILLSKERSLVMSRIKNQLENHSKSFGVEIIDVRIMRADLPKENSNAIYQRMRADREKEARELRAKGAAEAEKIKAEANREHTIIIANAEKDSAYIKADADAAAAKIYSKAYSKDYDFFEFYSSMRAYRSALKKDNTELVISPNSDFFKYLQSSK
jgi:membrane protease subunit HflC